MVPLDDVRRMDLTQPGTLDVLGQQRPQAVLQRLGLDAASVGTEPRDQVVGLEQENHQIKAVRVQTPDGEKRIEGEHFISSMPVRNVRTSTFHAPGSESTSRASRIR